MFEEHGTTCDTLLPQMQLLNDDQSYGKQMEDIGSVATKEYELGISHGSVVYWERFRDVDETLVTKRKYNRGRWTRQHQWLFGGYERGSGNSFLVLVRRRDARTLLKLITKYIRPGTTIISDSWRAYNGISSLPQGYLHLTVNHRMNFVDLNSGAHTQNIECHWQKFKALAKRKYGINSRRYVDYLSEFLWKKRFGGRDEAMFNFWDQIAALCPC
ncbi:unnamed protein product [Nippostrongylus brasiliensis]|uniref:DDE_Tnp_IS1595 domain-containing protein n=1 Tax=Nippostrongylus brasiliensis TaxID=27835 RepID=A0A0N4YKJ3_NIPBR|nr:unnamed protein product [Nippostrongylus brasiliensis]